MNLRTWGARWNLPFEAIIDLEREVFGHLGTFGVVANGKTEAFAQSEVRIDAARHGVLMFRNNVGALKDESGRVVRFGLANDSKELNARLKSSDLIGVRKRTIGPEDVGSVIGQMVVRECKPPGWLFGQDLAREEPQQAFLTLISSYGGDAKFATGKGSFDE